MSYCNTSLEWMLTVASQPKPANPWASPQMLVKEGKEILDADHDDDCDDVLHRHFSSWIPGPVDNDQALTKLAILSCVFGPAFFYISPGRYYVSHSSLLPSTPSSLPLLHSYIAWTLAKLAAASDNIKLAALLAHFTKKLRKSTTRIALRLIRASSGSHFDGKITWKVTPYLILRECEK